MKSMSFPADCYKCLLCIPYFDLSSMLSVTLSFPCSYLFGNLQYVVTFFKCLPNIKLHVNNLDIYCTI